SSSSLMAEKRSTRRATRPLGSGRPAFINGSSLAIQACASASSSRLAPVAMIFAMTTSSSSPNSAVTSLRVSVLMAASQMVASADRHGNETHRLAPCVLAVRANVSFALVGDLREKSSHKARRVPLDVPGGPEGQPLQGLGYIAGPDAPCGTISEFHHMAPIMLLDLHRRSPCDRIRAFEINPIRAKTVPADRNRGMSKDRS